MDPSRAKSISHLVVHTKFEWKQEKLVLCLAIDGGEQVEFDIVPYLGRGVLKTINLTFPNPNMKQYKIIALFKKH
jgi:hypothetical protein